MNWALLVFVFSQKELNEEEYGPTMADLEKQIAAHSILHKEIKAYSPQLCVSSAGGKVSRIIFWFSFSVTWKSSRTC